MPPKSFNHHRGRRSAFRWDGFIRRATLWQAAVTTVIVEAGNIQAKREPGGTGETCVSLETAPVRR